jgi:hypothetical protein
MVTRVQWSAVGVGLAPRTARTAKMTSGPATGSQQARGTREQPGIKRRRS